MGEEQSKMVEEREDIAVKEAYELDLETGDDAEEAMRSALDAVEKKRRRKTIPIDEPNAETDEESPSEPTGGAQEAAEEAPNDGAAALKARLLRTLADFDNFRKRTEREKETLRRFAVSEVVKDVLGVIDNLERAIGASGTIEELRHGLEMVLRQQAEVMKRFGVEPIDAENKPFDPTMHEAVAREDSSEITTPTVIRELQKGYMIHDRLLRPSMVHVAMPSVAAAKSSEDEVASTDGDETGNSE